MVSFSNADGAHYDSVNSQGTVQSRTLQMDVKIPVQPSNFDALQMGALLGASTFTKHNKNHIYQYKYATKSIPSPAPLFRRTRLWRVFCFQGSARFLIVLSTTTPTLPHHAS